MNQIRDASRRNNLFVDLKNVRTITPDTVAALLATIKEENITQHTSIIGNEPIDENSRQLLWDSGFFDHVQREVALKRKQVAGAIERRDILSEKESRVVDAKTAASLIDFASTALSGRSKKMGTSYGTMLDLMGNTLAHAGQGKNLARIFQVLQRVQRLGGQPCIAISNKVRRVLRLSTRASASFAVYVWVRVSGS